MPSFLTPNALSDLSAKFIINIANDLKVIVAVGQSTDSNGDSIDWVNANGNWKTITNSINTICTQMTNKGLGTYVDNVFTFQISYFASYQQTSYIDIASIDFSTIISGNANCIMGNAQHTDVERLTAITEIQNQIDNAAAIMNILLSH